MDIKVLYEDNHLIAVYKPAGALVQAGEGGGHDDDTLYWQVKQFIKERDQKPGNVFLGVLHRLDRNVSGVILFAKTSKGAARLSEQIRDRLIKKIYHAVVIGIPSPASATLRHNLRKDESSKQSLIGPTGDEAVLQYETLKSNDTYSLLRIELETGRFHQIRAQLAAIGHPIVGDLKYGAPEGLPDKSLMLCATELTFTTATTDEEVKVSIEIPSSWGTFIS
jgi:23S rRNA pseudouridine1911/1915/1917 synthase